MPQTVRLNQVSLPRLTSADPMRLDDTFREEIRLLASQKQHPRPEAIARLIKKIETLETPDKATCAS